MKTLDDVDWADHCFNTSSDTEPSTIKQARATVDWEEWKPSIIDQVCHPPNAI